MKILVVDNEPELVEMLGCWLHGRGYEVLASESALEALQLLGREKCDVVLLDVMLPDENGLMVLPDIVMMSPNTRIVVMSALHKEFWMQQASDSGADYCISKPINLEKLDQILHHFQLAAIS
jgi:DNA-binding response OmpR family regulator